ncbi:MAG: HDIG domain-containing metalloprotein [Pseudomonadota bacterium]
MKLPDAEKGWAERTAVRLGQLGLVTSGPELRSTLRRTGLLLLLAAATAGIMMPALYGAKYPVSENLLGSFATTNYKADRDYEIPDAVTSARLREEAVAAVPPVYDLDRRVATEVAANLRAAFAHINKVALGEGDTAASTEDGGVVEALPAGSAYTERLQGERERFQSLLGLPVEAALYDSLVGVALDRSLGPTLASTVGDVLESGVISDRTAVASEGVEIISVRTTQNQNTRERRRDVESLVELGDARERVTRHLRQALVDRSEAVREALIKLAVSSLRPTLIYNREFTEERRQVSATTVKPVAIKVRRGEMILRDGDAFQSRHLLIFRGMQEAQRSQRLTVFGSGVMFLVLTLIAGLRFFGRRSLRTLHLEDKDLLALTLVLFATVALATGWSAVAPAIQERLPGLALPAIRQMVPVSFGAMLIGFLMAPEVALLFAVTAAVLSGLAMEASLPFAIYTLVGSVVAAAGVARARLRTTLMKAGFLTGVASVVTGLCLRLATGTTPGWNDLGAHLLFGMVSGLSAALIVAGLVPVIEAVFGYVSDIKLLELANLNHPLLRELIVQAPGTYHHSIIIGSLVETGAEVIGANALLARVMAYYHDVGKIKSPRYFAENQRDGQNPHDKLAPSMSALILRSHVKDGMELARQHKLPAIVTDAIIEHHGNNLMTFFFERAKGSADAEVQTINEVDYRYAGRRPQSRETALVMIGDAVEAASRSVPDPTSERLLGLVQKTINRLFADGSLDQSQLTLKDLHEIAKAFHRVLLGIYHERPAYSTPATKERRADTKEIPRERKDTRPETKDSNARERSADSEGAERGKEAARAKGERQGNGPGSGAGDRAARSETTPENLKRLGSDP